MKRKDLLLHPGGLMRCCVHWAQHWIEADPDADAKDGERIECLSEHKETMAVVSGAIRWTGAE
jgi:hypothetical protein